MRHKGANFQPWSFCERCWFQYPISMLVSQLGLRVCTLYCYDNLDLLWRPYQIAQILNDTEEKKPYTPEIMFNPEEIYF